MLQGQHPFDLEATVTALLPDFPTGDPVVLKTPDDAQAQGEFQGYLAQEVATLFRTGDPFDFRAAIFPLAPVSACIALGYYLTNRPRVRLFQFHRDDQTWAWPDRIAPAPSITVTGIANSVITDIGEVAIRFSLSATVTDATVYDIKQDFLARLYPFAAKMLPIIKMYYTKPAT